MEEKPSTWVTGSESKNRKGQGATPGRVLWVLLSRLDCDTRRPPETISKDQYDLSYLKIKSHYCIKKNEQGKYEKQGDWEANIQGRN